MDEGRGKESRREVLTETALRGSPESLSSHIHTKTTLSIVPSGALTVLLLKSTLMRYNLYTIKCIHFDDIIV